MNAPLHDNVAFRVRKIVSENLGLDIESPSLTNEARLQEDLAADSLDSVEIVMAVEDEFSIEVNDDDAKECTTIGAIIDLINRSPKA